jgi:hypothetical protein
LTPDRARHSRDERVFRRARKVGRAFLVAATVAFVALVATSSPGTLSAEAAAAADAQLSDQLQAELGDQGGLPVPGAGSAAASAPLTPLQQHIQDALFATSWGKLTPSLDQLSTYLHKQWSDGCFDVDESNAASCVSGSAGATHRAVVLGDSISGAWLPGLQAALEPHGWSVQTLGMGQCPNITATVLYNAQPFTGCNDHHTWALNYIQRTRPGLVVLSNAYSASLADPSANKPNTWRTGLTSVIQQIQASGAAVVVLSSPPGGANLQACATSLSSPSDCTSSPSSVWRQYSGIEKQVAAATGATFVDAEGWFCLQDSCPAAVDGAPVYADGVHMTAEYSAKLAPYLATAILPQS